MKYAEEILAQSLMELLNASDILRHSFDKCRRIGLQEGLNTDELESFEALTSRFARLSDMIIQKTFKLLDHLELEDSGSARDRINRAEKRGVIQSANDFVEIRILRNEIAHDYKSDSIFNIFERVLFYTPVLLEAVETIEKYIQNSRHQDKIW
jgi:hypothetical protein